MEALRHAPPAHRWPLGWPQIATHATKLQLFSKCGVLSRSVAPLRLLLDLVGTIMDWAGKLRYRFCETGGLQPSKTAWCRGTDALVEVTTGSIFSTN
jgi:hypothetical protein